MASALVSTQLTDSFTRFDTYPKNIVEKVSGAYFSSLETYCLPEDTKALAPTNLELYASLLDKSKDLIFKEDEADENYEIRIREWETSTSRGEIK